MVAVIFDCDGVLVDSEPVYARAFSCALACKGVVISEDALRAALQGMSLSACYEWLSEHHGVIIDEAFKSSLLTESRRLLATELQAIPGVELVLSRLAVARAVASNGLRESVLGNIKRCGFERFFGEHVYTADCVKRGKPAPDLYLYAAKKIGVLPERCLVVEDSAVGVRAALAAGMGVCWLQHPNVMQLQSEKEVLEANESVFVVSTMSEVADWLARSGALA